MPQHITVVDYDPDWPRQFQAEAARIRAVLGDNCTAIYHIGSTAVPSLAAKPILDIMPVVENLEAVDRAAPAFEAMGYEYLVTWQCGTTSAPTGRPVRSTPA